MELYHTRGIILQDPTIDASRNFDRTIAFGMAVMANQKNKLNILFHCWNYLISSPFTYLTSAMMLLF